MSTIGPKPVNAPTNLTGKSASAKQAAVDGKNTANGTGVVGTSASGNGVLGKGGGTEGGPTGTGGNFEGAFEGVHAVGHHESAAGIAGYNTSTGPGVFGKSTHGPAGYFAGHVVVTGHIEMTGADLAEHFAVTDELPPEPGTVMVLDGADRVRASEVAYDRKVIGIVSGAGGYRPGVLLDHQAAVPGRHPLAMVGKVYCKIDATYGPIDVGDLLTTSPTPGHAMKAADGARAFGAVLGKAMAPLPEGLGLLPVLVALQ